MIHRTYSVYVITCRETGKAYIGTTIESIARRYRGHWSRSRRGSDAPLHVDMRRVDSCAFVVELIAEYDTYEAMLARERSEIAARHTLIPHGYNQVRGGPGNYGWQMRAETRDKIAAKTLGRQPWNKGRTMDAMYCAIMRAACQKREANRRARGVRRPAWNRGMPPSVEHRAKISTALKGRRYSPEELAAHRGLKRSPESRQRISEAKKRWWTTLTQEQHVAQVAKMRGGSMELNTC